jgi:hypothetical protein
MLEHVACWWKVRVATMVGGQRDGTVVEIREKGRWWRSEGWEVVEIREKRRWRRSEKWEGDGVKENER